LAADIYEIDHARVCALLFDLGGVVIGVDFVRAFRVWAARASCDPTELGRRFKFDAAFEEYERGKLDASGYFAALRSSLGVALSDEDLVAGWNDIYIGPVPEMAALLVAAGQRFPLFAFTNSNPTHQSVWAVRFAEELSVFRSVFVSSDLGLRKPDPDAFAAVASRMGLDPSAVLFFDDTLENVDGALSAGMQAVLVTSVDDVRRALRTLEIEVRGVEEPEK